MRAPDATATADAPVAAVAPERPRSVAVRLVADVPPEVWAFEHAHGRRPDGSPYGVHRLAGEGFDVRVDPLPVAGSRLAARLERAARHRGRGVEWWAGLRREPTGRAELLACWDERTGLPALARHGTAVATGVIWLTDSPLPWSRAVRGLLGRAAAVWALSSAQLPTLREQWRIPASRLHHLPFGIDEQFWAPTGVVARPEVDVVLGVGNDRHRDHAGLVAAAAGLPARLSLVTSLPVEVPAHIGERTASLAHVALRARYEQAAVVAVLLRPNSHVSGVTTVLEAQAMGRPVVVTDTPGMRDYVRAGVTGELVPPGDIDAARAAIAGLLADPDRAHEMGRAGREFVRSHATSALMATRLAEILQRV